mmetsp:Transcript_21580/g.42382  ORF Transcript_21580/g.42382 Transcript_21580/m.42382 type:complete len:84 (-) Transcript_21580:40-291(-)
MNAVLFIYEDSSQLDLLPTLCFSTIPPFTYTHGRRAYIVAGIHDSKVLINSAEVVAYLSKRNVIADAALQLKALHSPEEQNSM